MQDVALRREIDYRRLAEVEVREDALPASEASDAASGLSDEGRQVVSFRPVFGLTP
ncbi:hypothetical protein AB0P45_20850 [Streptomyces niveus]|uniref:hypothetical protein n=1 Tax=Streptomyces niveus TaxID=193462 RepID=UPI00341D53F5